MVHSRRFLSAAGMAPAYSGVLKSQGSAAPPGRRISAQTGPTGTPSRSSSGLNSGRAPIPRYSTVCTPSGATAAAVCRTPALVAPSRLEPETSRILTGGGAGTTRHLSPDPPIIGDPGLAARGYGRMGVVGEISLTG